jgi:DHA1 family bicyclomycin/chloramphenicol resistance-like MFS transporter
MFARLAAARAVPPANSPLFLAILGILMSFGPMGTDMYLPALPDIQGDFHATQEQAQRTLSAFFLGFGVGQLLWGALADWLGRRRPIAAGILLYGIGCVGCSLSTDIDHLVAWRFIQAMGACAGPVLVRAMIRDVFERDRAASVLSLMMLIMGIAPIIAPLIGGHLLVLADWRGIFWAQASFGIVALTALTIIPETLAPINRRRMRVVGLLQSYRALLTNRRYLGYALNSAFVYAGMFAFLSGSPFVYIDLFHVRPEHYGLLFGINIVGMIIVNTINSRIVLRFGTDRLLGLGSVLSAASGLLLLTCAMMGWGGLWGLVGCLFLFMGLTGLIIPNAMAGAMAAYPHMAGTASALAGMMQFAFGAVSGWVVGLIADGTAVPMAAVIAASALAVLISNLLLVRRSAR